MSLLFALETGWRSKCFVPAFSDVKRWKMTIKRNFIFFFQIGTSRQLSTSFIRWHRRLQARALYDKLRKLQHFGSDVEGRGQAAQENFFLGMSLGMNRDRSKRSYVWDVRWGWRRAHPIQSCDWRLTSELVGAPNVELCPGLSGLRHPWCDSLDHGDACVPHLSRSPKLWGVQTFRQVLFLPQGCI